MGVAIADYDEDGDMDIVKTNFSDDVPNVYHNSGDGTFEDRVLQSGLGGYMQFVGWGVHLLDVDHDGRRDLLMINGHVYPEAERTPEIALSPAAAALLARRRRPLQGHLRRAPGRRSRRSLVVARIGGRRSRQRRIARGGGQQHRARGRAC